MIEIPEDFRDDASEEEFKAGFAAQRQAAQELLKLFERAMVLCEPGSPQYQEMAESIATCLTLLKRLEDFEVRLQEPS